MSGGSQSMGSFAREKLPEPLVFYQARGLVLQPGKEWRTTSCEFHNSKATMRVNMKSGAFVCMAGCGAKGGSVLHYHMAINGIEFYQAAKQLGAIETNGLPYTGPQRPARIPAQELLRLASDKLYVCATVVHNLLDVLVEYPELAEALALKINTNDLQSFFEAAGQVIYVSEISNG